MLYRARCSLVPRETRKKNRGNSLARDNLSSGSSSSRRADCCSSLSPISDCFFKAPVAEDINYPASVNHVICRPRPRGPRGDRGNRRGERRNRRRRRRMRTKRWRRGRWERDVRIRRGIVLRDARVLHRCQPSKTLVGCSPRPQQYPARRYRNLSATRPKLSSRPMVDPFNGTTRSPAVTLPIDRSFASANSGSRASRSRMMLHFSLSLRFTRLYR